MKYGNFIYNKEGQYLTSVGIPIFLNFVLAKLYSDLENNNIGSVLYICTKVNSKWIPNQNVKNKTQTRAPVCFCSAAQTQHPSVPNTELMTFLGKKGCGPCLKEKKCANSLPQHKAMPRTGVITPAGQASWSPRLGQEGAEGHTFKSIQVVQIPPLATCQHHHPPRLMPDPTCKYLHLPHRPSASKAPNTQGKNDQIKQNTNKNKTIQAPEAESKYKWKTGEKYTHLFSQRTNHLPEIAAKKTNREKTHTCQDMFNFPPHKRTANSNDTETPFLTYRMAKNVQV